MPESLKVQADPGGECVACRTGKGLSFEITMAFQPIVDVHTRRVWAYEALVRGKEGQSAAHVLAQVTEENRYSFDQTCRVKAIELASALGVARNGAKLSLNFMPGAIYDPAACLRRTLQAARFFQFPLEAIVFEITEGERVASTAHLQKIAIEYARHGFMLALDDFGAGFSGLNLLSELQGLQLIKLDGALIRSLDSNPRAEQIVAAMCALCSALGVSVLAECVETTAEYHCLRRLGIRLMQGYLFARPGYECLPEVEWPTESERDVSAPAVPARVAVLT